VSLSGLNPASGSIAKPEKICIGFSYIDLAELSLCVSEFIAAYLLLGRFRNVPSRIIFFISEKSNLLCQELY
jgi:hypothetical protein